VGVLVELRYRGAPLAGAATTAFILRSGSRSPLAFRSPGRTPPHRGQPLALG
jgi:hypothetical protein